MMTKKLPGILFVLLAITSGSALMAQDFAGNLPINGTELYVKTMGQGEPVIVVHGGPVLDHSYLLPSLKPLANDYKLIFYDQRLSGRSSADVDTSSIRLSTFVEDIEALRKKLNLGAVHLLAHSWGGLLAAKYAITYPENIKTLILSNAIPPTSELWGKENRELARRSTKEDSLKRQQIIQSDLFRNNPSKGIKKLLIHSFRNQFYNPELADRLDLYIPSDYRTRSRLFSHIMPDLSSYDLVPDLKNLQVPTLIIYGDIEPANDISGPVLGNAIENSVRVTLKKAGHFPFIERPEEFRLVVTKFLNNH